MVAIITAETKKRFIDEFKNDADSASVNYYIGISRSEDWNDADTAPTPLNTEREQRTFREGLQSIKKVINYSFVIPRKNWIANSPFAAYSDTAEAHPAISYYAMTANNSVYVCLREGVNVSTGVRTNSTVEPTGSSTAPFTTSDGYAWKFLYTIGTLDASFYKSANFIPVKLQGATDSSSPATDVEQLAIQNAADSGRQIVGFSIDSDGEGYTSNPTVVITGNGSGAAGTAQFGSGGVIVSIRVADSAGTLKMGTGYDFANFVLDGGGANKPGTGKVILGPKAGFGADPTNDLRARAIMFNAKPNGEEKPSADSDGEFIIGNSFRQIGLLRAPTTPAGALFDSAEGNALRRLQMQGQGALTFTQRSIMTSASGAKGFVDKVDSDEIYYHQTESTGFKQFTEAESVTDTAGGSGTTQAAGDDGDANAFVEPKVDKYSGQLLYIENRAAVIRSADQTEDIKVIIEI